MQRRRLAAFALFQQRLIPSAQGIEGLLALNRSGLYVSLSALPMILVGNRVVFALKIAGLIVVTNLVGFALYASSRRRMRTLSA